MRNSSIMLNQIRKFNLKFFKFFFHKFHKISYKFNAKINRKIENLRNEKKKKRELLIY